MQCDAHNRGITSGLGLQCLDACFTCCCGMFGTTSGRWLATYGDTSPLPESFTAAVRAYGSGSDGSEMVSAVFKPH